LNATNLNQSNHLELFMNGLIKNDMIERLDFSDNGINDAEGLHIVRYIKKQAETRDNALWMTGLRHSNVDERRPLYQ
jgi:hypothetical protein